MYAITFENEAHQQWPCDLLFKNFAEAKGYLTSKGFTEKNRLFERRDYRWSKYVKAYVTPKKIYEAGMNPIIMEKEQTK